MAVLTNTKRREPFTSGLARAVFFWGLSLMVFVSLGCQPGATRPRTETRPTPVAATPTPTPVTQTEHVRQEQVEVARAEPTRSVLITVDDLPVAMRGGYRNDAERRATIDKLVAVLSRRGVPFVGFFNMGHHGHDPSLTERWLEAETMVVGNHTWSHPNAKRTPLEAYLADLTRGHEAVARLRPEQEMIPFRFPDLDQGFDPKKREAIFARLHTLGSRHIPVTIDTRDWLYAKGYLSALHAKKPDEMERYHRGWLWDIQERTLIAEHLAQELWGRQPPQILLLHANRLNADHLDEALDWYEARGYRFVTLSETLADPAYDEIDRSYSPTGDSHWLRLRRSRDLNAGAKEPTPDDDPDAGP